MPLADTQAIALMLRRPASTIRYWAHRGHLKRKGTDTKGRALYATEDAENLISRLNLTNTPDLHQHQNDIRGSVPHA